MIRARRGSTIILGLSAENLKRLQAGDDMHFQLADIGLPYDVRITFGPTEQDIAKRFQPAPGADTSPIKLN